MYFKKLFYARELQDVQVEIDHANVIITYEQCSIDYCKKNKKRQLLTNLNITFQLSSVVCPVMDS